MLNKERTLDSMRGETRPVSAVQCSLALWMFPFTAFNKPSLPPMLPSFYPSTDPLVSSRSISVKIEERNQVFLIGYPLLSSVNIWKSILSRHKFVWKSLAMNSLKVILLRSNLNILWGLWVVQQLGGPVATWTNYRFDVFHLEIFSLRAIEACHFFFTINKTFSDMMTLAVWPSSVPSQRAIPPSRIGSDCQGIGIIIACMLKHLIYTLHWVVWSRI